MATNFDGIINGNKIYNITNASTAASDVTPAIAAGIFFRFTGGSNAAINNMISLGSGQDNNAAYIGIINVIDYDGNTLNIFHNTIRLSGTVTSGGLNSYCFRRGYSASDSSVALVNIKNNIFDNQRSGGTGKHYAIGNLYWSYNWNANASDYNVLNSSSAATVGNWLDVDQTFTGWKTSSSCDANSHSGETVIYNDIPTADLHLNMGTTATVLESGGVLIPDLTFDFDGDVRPGPAGSVNGGATAPDIGADEFDGVPAASTFPLTVKVNSGWNMVSIPGLLPTNQLVTSWWPGKDPGANVFYYSGGDSPGDTAKPGFGYWMKNLGADTLNTGDEWPAGGINLIPHDPINVALGWNLVGGYENLAPTGGITPSGGISILRSIYGYSGGYSPEDTLEPGFGYWIKLSGAGQIFMPTSLYRGTSKIAELINKDWGKIIITDAAGRDYTLYAVSGDVNLEMFDLPPVPPSGMFDVRYSSGRYAEDLNESIQQIDLNGMVYPVKVKAEGINIRLQDETGKIVNERLRIGEEIN